MQKKDEYLIDDTFRALLQFFFNYLHFLNFTSYTHIYSKPKAILSLAPMDIFVQDRK